MSARNKIAEIDAKIAKLQAARAELEAAAANEVDTGSIEAGDTVTFEYGRKDKSVKSGTVLGVKREEGKRTVVKVLVGEGADSEIVSSFTAAIRSVTKKAGE